LRDIGFIGCTEYDCFGAGQSVCTVSLPAVSWKAGPRAMEALAGAFAAQRDISELSWYCASALLHIAAFAPPAP
jgi:hypothetical protein